MKRIAITGANGTIGTVLSNGLKNYEIIPIDLPMLDARDYEKLLKAVQGSDVIVHLAWNTEIENFRSSKIEVGNILMVYNVYKAALEAKIPRVIMMKNWQISVIVKLALFFKLSIFCQEPRWQKM